MAALTIKNLPAATPIYLLLKGGYKQVISGARSVAAEDADQYDGSTYSQLVGADVLGNAHTQIKRDVAAKTSGAVVSSASDLATAWGNSQLTQMPTLGEAVTEAEVTDASFVTTTTPGRTLKTRTIWRFFDEINGGGNLVAQVWADQVVSLTPAAPSLVT